MDRDKCSINVEKIQNYAAGLGDHNNRINIPNDVKPWIDESRSHLNYDLIPCANYETAIKEKLSAAKLTRKLTLSGERKSILAMSFCVYAPTNNDHNLNRKYFEDCLKFIETLVGSNNIIAAQVHNDERTPHMHIVCVPLIQKKNKKGELKNHLSYKDFFGSPSQLRQLQTDFAKEVGAKYGLKRGNPRCKGQKNITINEYRANAERVEIINRGRKVNENLAAKIAEKKALTLEVETSMAAVKAAVKKERDFLERDLQKMTDVWNDGKRQIAEQEKLKAELENGNYELAQRIVFERQQQNRSNNAKFSRR